MQVVSITKNRPAHRLANNPASSSHKNTPESMHTLKNNQLAAVESLVLLLLREVDSMKKIESRVDEGIKGEGINLHDELQRFEISMIRSALIQTGGIQRAAAQLLGMKVTTLNLKIKRYKINFTNLIIEEE